MPRRQCVRLDGGRGDELPAARRPSSKPASNFVDTADVYSKWAPGHHGGESETIIGDWLKRRGKRDDVVIATKVGSEMAPRKKGLSKAYILRAVDESLRRLGTDYIDLYQSHRDDPDTPIEETLEAYGALIKAGKVRAIGASNFTAERLAGVAGGRARTHGLPRYETLQPEYNLMVRDVREGAGPAVRKARGRRHSLFRSGLRLPDRQIPQQGGPEAEPARRGCRSLSQPARLRGPGRARRGRRTASRHAGAGRARLADGATSVTAPIASATSPKQLGDLVASARLRLAAADIAQLESASA